MSDEVLGQSETEGRTNFPQLRVVSGQVVDSDEVDLAAERRTRPRNRSGSLPQPGPRVSVVIATLNEEKHLPHVFGRLPHGLHELIVVDGHSVDDTNMTLRSGSGRVDTSRSASASTGSDSIQELRCTTSRQAASIAAITRGWLCPTVAQICPAAKSRTRCPSTVSTEGPRRPAHHAVDEVAPIPNQQVCAVVHVPHPTAWAAVRVVAAGDQADHRIRERVDWHPPVRGSELRVTVASAVGSRADPNDRARSYVRPG